MRKSIQKIILAMVVTMILFQSIQSVSAINSLKIVEKYNVRNPIIDVKESNKCTTK